VPKSVHGQRSPMTSEPRRQAALLSLPASAHLRGALRRGRRDRLTPSTSFTTTLTPLRQAKAWGPLRWCMTQFPGVQPPVLTAAR